MMLTALTFDHDRCLKEAKEFAAFLGGRTTLKERDEVLPFFKARVHLSAFLGVNNARIIQYDRYAHEYPLFGDFTCDLVVGDWDRRAYVFVEFEDARPDSIFVKKAKHTPEWAARFEHGFSQILDWLYKLDTQRHNPEFETRFGDRVVYVSGLLVVGRRQDLEARERDRLAWRHRHVSVNGVPIYSLTYDDLCEDTLERLTTYAKLTKAMAAKTKGKKGP